MSLSKSLTQSKISKLDEKLNNLQAFVFVVDDHLDSYQKNSSLNQTKFGIKFHINKSEGTYEFYPCETLAGAVCEANFECRKGYEDRHCARLEKGFMFAFGQSFKCDDNPGSKWTITLTLYVALVSFVLLVIYFTTQFDSFDLYLNSLQNLALVFSSQLTYPKMTYRASQVIFPIVLFDISESIYPTCVHPSWTWAHG